MWHHNGVDTDVLITVLAGLLLAVAAVGTVYPVLPGSLLAIVTLIAWGWVVGSSAAWTAAALGALIAAAGWSASAVLTGRKLKQQKVPRRSIAVAVVAAVVGMFLIPVVGLFVGFGVGLLAGEYVRRGDFPAALTSSVETLKATGPASSSSSRSRASPHRCGRSARSSTSRWGRRGSGAAAAALAVRRHRRAAAQEAGAHAALLRRAPVTQPLEPDVLVAGRARDVVDAHDAIHDSSVLSMSRQTPGLTARTNPLTTRTPSGMSLRSTQ